MDIIELLNWRYATKKMDPTRAVAEATVARIVEAIRLAPTSSGLQPYELLVVTNPALRDQLKGAAWGQSQVTDCSHLLVFAAWDDYTPERINQVFDLTVAERGGSNEGWETYRNRLLATYPARGADVNFVHTAKQTYIALGVALVAAAAEGVDSTPMEGFDPDKIDAILGLRQRGLRSVTLLPLGYRDAAGDWLVAQKKVRQPTARFVTELA